MPAFPEAHIREYLFTAYLVCGSGSVKRHLAKGEEELEGERGRPRNFHVVGLMGLSPFCSRVHTLPISHPLVVARQHRGRSPILSAIDRSGIARLDDVLPFPGLH